MRDPIGRSLRAFVEARIPGGISTPQARDIFRVLRTDPHPEEALKALLHEFADDFTPAGEQTLQKLGETLGRPASRLPSAQRPGTGADGDRLSSADPIPAIEPGVAPPGSGAELVAGKSPGSALALAGDQAEAGGGCPAGRCAPAARCSCGGGRADGPGGASFPAAGDGADAAGADAAGADGAGAGAAGADGAGAEASGGEGRAATEAGASTEVDEVLEAALAALGARGAVARDVLKTMAACADHLEADLRKLEAGLRMIEARSLEHTIGTQRARDEDDASVRSLRLLTDSPKLRSTQPLRPDEASHLALQRGSLEARLGQVTEWHGTLRAEEAQLRAFDLPEENLEQGMVDALSRALAVLGEYRRSETPPGPVDALISRARTELQWVKSQLDAERSGLAAKLPRTYRLT